MTPEVVIAGGGPAGCVAAILLARTGAHVRLFDRARFPRRKLCGDTLNPGACHLLERLGLFDGLEDLALPVRGMLLTGPGAQVEGLYPAGVRGLAITRSVLDARLLAAAAAAGVTVEDGTQVTGAVMGGRTGARVAGLQLASRGGRSAVVRGRLCIAADGRHSRLAFGLGLAWHPAWPRRWAVGAYYTDVDEVGDCGEMHIRDDYYIGVARVPGGLVNVCLVTADRARLRTPAATLRSVLASDERLRDRFAGARRAAPVVTLGPLAVESRAPGLPGLLVAGDAAGFIDPMTGDGLRLAIRSGELAAQAAALALEGRTSAPEILLGEWQREFARKRALNRTLRRLVAGRLCVRAASLTARVLPALFSHLVRVAGDVPAGAAA